MSKPRSHLASCTHTTLSSLSRSKPRSTLTALEDVRYDENTQLTQSETRCLTAEEVTQIVPEIPSTINDHQGRTPKVLVWANLVVSVPIVSQRPRFERLKFWEKTAKHAGRRQILHDVSGIAEPGEILAVMGESGAGKTTLMNVLTQRNLQSLEVEGEVTVNGEPVTPLELQRMSSYVQQADLFMGSVTVREHLIFSARLRMGRQYSGKEKVARVENVIRQMNLVSCQHTMIGCRYEKSISLGEKKRLSFAAEILTNPSILFCDEPTSGLDAFMAKQVMKALKGLAEEGKTIVITIHQPSSQVFDLFNKLCLMSLGHIIYLGPAKKVITVFRNAGLPMRGRDNPAEFFIEQLALHGDETEDERKDRVLHVKKVYDESSMAHLYFSRIHGPISERRRRMGNSDIRKGNRYAASWFTQVLWLAVRSFRATLRDPLLLKIRLIQTVLTAIMVGLVNFRVPLKQETVITYNGFMFNSVRDCIFMFMFPCITVFADELPIFLRENHGNIYRTDAYFIGKNLAELPQYIVLPFIYAIIVYFMSGMLHSWGQFGLYIFICITVTNLATSIGYCAACIFGTNEVASQILPLITVPMMVFGGFYINLRSIPSYFWIFKYISWNRYAFEAHMINMWYDHKVVPGCEKNATLCLTGDTGPHILDHFTFSNNWWMFGRNIGILITYILGFRSIGILALFLRSRLAR